MGLLPQLLFSLPPKLNPAMAHDMVKRVHRGFPMFQLEES